MKPKVGDNAPGFELPDQDGKLHKLSDYSGKHVLLYFYPKDFTPGCTTEACELRDNFPDFENLGVKVFGVSTDSVESHKRFAERHKLPFTLLADENKKVAKSYGVWKPKKIFGREFLGTHRTSFLIDPKEKIINIYSNVKPKIHAEEVL
ncbi:thioredoxin-dependent thiol peroxidase, partial [Patescibacteria group bacterium]|nr:thioredoxin-dependent thiol peroxidase [Patescibacteria group bacterium]